MTVQINATLFTFCIICSESSTFGSLTLLHILHLTDKLKNILCVIACVSEYIVLFSLFSHSTEFLLQLKLFWFQIYAKYTLLSWLKSFQIKMKYSPNWQWNYIANALNRPDVCWKCRVQNVMSPHCYEMLINLNKVL